MQTGVSTTGTLTGTMARPAAQPATLFIEIDGEALLSP
jgi:hypothetical protein